jgi:hypothetical protein
VAASAVIITSREQEVSPAGETSVVTAPIENQAVTLQLPEKRVKLEKLEIDLTTKRAFIPAEGWVSARTFWKIYFEQPEKLPGEIDFERLQQFEKVTELQRKQALGLAEGAAHLEDKIATVKLPPAPVQAEEVIPQDPAAQQ